MRRNTTAFQEDVIPAVVSGDPEKDVIPRGFKRGIHGSRLTTCRDDTLSGFPIREFGNGNKSGRRYIAIVLLGLLAGPLHGKGLVLPKSEPAKETSKEHPYLLIGDIVPNSLTLTDGEGKTRSLLSYKSSLEVMVLEFLSPRCPINVLAWRDLKRLYEAYKEWRVVFVGISVQPEESAGELAEAMAKAGLPYPALRDQNQSVARALHVLATPEIVIIDEWGHLRYRGALHDPPDVGRGLASSVAGAIQTPGKRPNIQYARDALDTVIGHVEAVPNAEPGGFIGCRIRGNTGNVRE